MKRRKYFSLSLGYFSAPQKNENTRFSYTSVGKSDFSNHVQKKVTFPHWSKKFSALFWVLSTSLSCAESSPSIRKGNSCSIWLWKSKFHVQKIIPCPCSPLFWISVFLWKFLNGPHGPTSFRNFHKNTSNQKRGELVQGKLFCTVTFLFHTSNWAGKAYSSTLSNDAQNTEDKWYLSFLVTKQWAWSKFNEVWNTELIFAREFLCFQVSFSLILKAWGELARGVKSIHTSEVI